MTMLMQSRTARLRIAMMASVSLCVTAISMAVVPVASAASLVGTVVPPLPDGSTELGGRCIGKVTASGCTQTVGEVGSQKGGIAGLYVGSFVDADAQGHPRWRVTDFIAVPETKKPYAFADTACRYRGQDDESIAAIVHEEGDDKAWLKAKDWAYRVDLATGKFVKLAAAEVECANLAREAD